MSNTAVEILHAAASDLVHLSNGGELDRRTLQAHADALRELADLLAGGTMHVHLLARAFQVATDTRVKLEHDVPAEDDYRTSVAWHRAHDTWLVAMKEARQRERAAHDALLSAARGGA